MSKILKAVWLALVFLFSCPVSAQSLDTVSVMFYNLLEFPLFTGVPSREDSLKEIVQYAQPDLLVVCEMNDVSGVGMILNQALNVNGITDWQAASWIPNQSSGVNLQNMLFYRSGKFGLKNQSVVITDLRDINKYVLYFKDPNLAQHQDTTWIDVYGTHLKANSDGASQAQRAQEADSLRKYIDAEPSDRNRILAADFNFYNATEVANQTLLSGIWPFNDPIAAQGNWHNNIGYASIHTQCTRINQLGGTGASGGMDDRFDQILVSTPVLNGTDRVSVVPGTYVAFGNDGNHYNQSINAGVNTAVPAGIANALYYMSDHLPVFMEMAVEYPIVSNAPFATGAYSESAVSVVVEFSEAVNATAENVANYSLSPSIGIISALRTPSLDSVVLTLSTPLTLCQPYMLDVSGVQNLAGTPMSGSQSFPIQICNMVQDLVISEIMYNDPGAGTDALEFIEIYNNGSVAENLFGYMFDGVAFSFPDTLLQAGAFIVSAVNADSFHTVFGFTPLEWGSGALNNGGETLRLLDNFGATLDSVPFDDFGGWPNGADGGGPSLVLCDFDSDNALPASWELSQTSSGTYAGTALFASPGAQDDACPAPPLPCGKDGFEPNDISSQATNLASLSGFGDMRICPQGDEDWFSFPYQSNGASLRIRLSGLPADYDLEVYRNGILVGSSAIAGTGDESVMLPQATGGLYTLHVSGKNGAWSASKAYTLSVNSFRQATGGAIKNIPLDPEFRAPGSEIELQVYPNPFGQQLLLELNAVQEGQAEIRISDTVGRELFSEKRSVQSGMNSFSLELDALPSGFYFIEIRIGTDKLVWKGLKR